MALESGIKEIRWNGQNIGAYLFGLLMYLMLVVPLNINAVKTGLHFAILAVTLYSMKKEIVLNKECAVFICLFIIYALLASVWGVVNGNPGWKVFARLNIVYYLLLYAGMLTIYRAEHFIIIVRFLYFAAFSISIYTFLLLLHDSGYWIFDNFIRLDEYSVVGFHDTYTHITSTNLSMMTILFPFITLAAYDAKIREKIKLWYIIFTVVISAAAMFLSGRRILWIIMAGTLLIAAFKGLTRRGRLVCMIVCVILGFAALTYMNKYTSYSLQGYADRLFEVFQAVDSTTGEENIRFAEMRELFLGFLQRPVMGSGAGAGVEGYIRTAAEPWCYEVSYNLILYNSGIIGSLIYALAFIVFLLALWNKHRQSDKMGFAMLVTLIFGIVANGTNPYFSGSFDFLTFIFVPLVYLNCSCDWQQKNLQESRYPSGKDAVGRGA